MAHVKAGGTVKGNRDSIAKRLGIKVYAGQPVKNGNIIVRQKGSRYYAGLGTRLGKDFTLYAVQDGVVRFMQKLGKKMITVQTQ